MFSIRRDFGLAGKIFGVPRAILSRLCSFCSSWTVQGNIIKLSMPEFPDPVKNPITLSIDEDALRDAVGGGTGSVNTVDGHTPDANGAVSFGLTASKPVVTDANGNLTTASLTGSRIVKTNSGGALSVVGASGHSGTVDIVTNVEWTGTYLRKTIRTLTFTDGVLTSIGTASTTNIDTPTVITWS